MRQLSAGLTFQDYPRHPGQPRRHLGVDRAQALHAVEAAAAAAERSAGRLRRQPAYSADRQPAGRGAAASSTTAETTRAAPVAVLGEGAAASLFGADDPVGRYVKVNEQWFQVIGVAGPQLTVQADVARPAGAGPQQPDLRAAARGDLPPRRRQQPLSRRDRRHLPADAAGRRHPGGRGAAARPAQRLAPRRRRLHHRLAGRAPRRAAAHAAHLRDGDGGDRLDLAARRRHRHHEHHAGERDGADARDRRPPRDRRARSATSSASS